MNLLDLPGQLAPSNQAAVSPKPANHENTKARGSDQNDQRDRKFDMPLALPSQNNQAQPDKACASPTSRQLAP
jgi:hypothetical protein